MQIKRNSFITFLIYCVLANICFAKDFSNDINEVIKKSPVNKNGISISIKFSDNKNVFYQYNEKVPMPPASLQKLITTVPALQTLGKNYKFETKLYKDSTGNYLIVLGADPYLTTGDLRTLTQKMPPEVKSISIDDSILDSIEWGEGWQWDDEINPCMPKFSSYNIDRNTLKIYLKPTVKDAPAEMFFDKAYPMIFVNQIITSDSLQYTVEKKSTEMEDIVLGQGTINKMVTVPLPVNSPKKYFKLRLTDALLDNEKSNNGIYHNKKLNKNYKLVNVVSHNISTAQNDILKNSDNYVAETVFKLAGGKFIKGTGSFDAGLKMFNTYCKRNNIDNSCINIVDASGVSKNNLTNSDFMREYLFINKDLLEPIMANPGEGTLEDRLLYLNGSLKAKTGTLTNVSGLTGYLTTRNGHNYIFCILINDSKSKAKDKKILEDNLIKTLYLKG